GAVNSKFTISNTGQGPGGAMNFDSSNQAPAIWSDLIAFDIALTPTQMGALNTLLQSWYAPPTIAKAYNIVTDFSATCNGTADDSATFTSFNTAAVAWDIANPGVSGAIQLTIPNSKCMFKQVASGIAFTKGIVNHKIIVAGAGASSELSDGGTGGGWFLGSAGEVGTTNQATTQTASKGDTSVTLTACPGAGCTTALNLFTVGQWARMSGLAQQSNGFPTNPAFWDYVLVSGKTATGIQFTTTPLTHDYKSTWPSYGTAYYGGPATLYALDPSWPITLEVNNLILSMTNPASDGAAIIGKDITLKNVTINTTDGNTCEVPSQNMSYRIIKATMTNCTIEVDKIIDFAMLQNISAITSIDVQSASVKQMLISGANITGHTNTAINTTIYGSTIASFQPGPHSFGGAASTTLINNIVNGFQAGAASSSSVNSVGSWSGGVYTIPNASIPGVSGSNDSLPWAVPGLNIYWNGTLANQGPVIQVLDVSQSGSNTLVQTSLAGGFPTMPGASVAAFAHPAPIYYGSGNTGTALATVVLNPPATYQGLPLGSYYSQAITSSNGNPASPLTPYVWGQMVETDWTITAACGGASNFRWVPTNFVQVLGSASTSTWAPTANGLVASTTPRQMFPTTTAGSQSGDSLTAPSSGAWLASNQDQPSYSTVANCGSASTTVTIQ